MTSTELIDLTSLGRGAVIDVETKNRHYKIECLGGNAIRISGHPEYCPVPVLGQRAGDGLPSAVRAPLGCAFGNRTSPGDGEGAGALPGRIRVVSRRFRLEKQQVSVVSGPKRVVF